MPIPGMPALGSDTGAWTSGDQSQAFTRWMGANSRWERTLLGTTRQGRDLTALEVGTGPADQTMMLVGGVHGSEAQSAEAVHVWVREIANRLYDGDTTLEALLTRIRIVVIPMANPDGRQLNRYGNSQNVNPAQDGFALRAAERTAINLAFRMSDPLLVVDHHEYSTNPFVPMWVGCNRGDVAPGIMSLSRELMMRMRTKAEAWGQATLEYPIENRRALVHEATFRHMVGILIETAFGARIPWADTLRLHLDSIAEAITMFDNRISDFKAARAASITRALQSPGPDLIRFDDIEARPDDLRRLDLWGYQIEGEVPQRFIDAFGIEIVDGYVDMRQKARGFLPELFDPENSTAVFPAKRLLSPPGKPVEAFVRVGGQRRRVTQMIHMVGGQRRPVAFQ